MKHRSKLRASAASGLIGAALAFGACHAGEANGPVSVIELFTSQGCSSCPPADRLAQELSKRNDLIVLSFPVTYWDYLGWKDTLARPENTQRQHNYAASLGDGQVYTPQAIVNGIEGCVGSNRAAIESAVQTTSAAIAKEAVPLKAHRERGRLMIEAGQAVPGARHRSGKVWVAIIAPSATVTIARGENAGNAVTYTNVVDRLIPAGEWQGQPTAYAVPVDTVIKPGETAVVFLQTDNLGPIVGAARIDG